MIQSMGSKTTPLVGLALVALLCSCGESQVSYGPATASQSEEAALQDAATMLDMRPENGADQHEKMPSSEEGNE